MGVELNLWHLTVIFVLQADGETAVLVAGDPEREHMRKVRQDGGIRYHVNLLQAMVSIHKRLSARKHVTGTKRGKTCKVERGKTRLIICLVLLFSCLQTQLCALIGHITSWVVTVMFQPKILETNKRKTKANIYWIS